MTTNKYVDLARRALCLKDTDVVVPKELAALRQWVVDNAGKPQAQCTPWPGPCDPGSSVPYGLPSCPSLRLYFLTYNGAYLAILDLDGFHRHNRLRLELLDFICNPKYDAAKVQVAEAAVKKVRLLNRLIKASLKTSGLPAAVRALIKKET